MSSLDHDKSIARFLVNVLGIFDNRLMSLEKAKSAEQSTRDRMNMYEYSIEKVRASACKLCITNIFDVL